MAREKAFNFLTALVRALHQSRTEILAKTVVHCAGSNDPQSYAAHMLDDFMRSSLDGARKHCQYIATTATVLDTIKLCFVTGHMDICRAFLDQTRPRYSIGRQLSLLTNVINNILALKNCCATSVCLTGSHLSMRFVRL
jgi:hypothetical protein